MDTAGLFTGLLQNLKVGPDSALIASRRDEITKALNKSFRGKNGITQHRLMVGSYGRHTAIRGVSDLDMLFIVPEEFRSDYSDDNGPRRLLTKVKDILKNRYPTTEIRVDQCVVRVQFSSNKFTFEVQPVFENADGSFGYPDTAADGWRVTKPRDEISETRDCNNRTSNNMRHLARMIRAWKNTSGVNVGGLLIDTLVHRFFASTDVYDTAGASSYDIMVRDFFAFMKDEPEQNYYLALGSNQQVKVVARFQPGAKKAYNRCQEAIEAEGEVSAAEAWRIVFGTSVPLGVSEAARTYDDTEEFIEDQFPVDICHSLHIDCEVTQKGWRPKSLRLMLQAKSFLHTERDLKFTLMECSVSKPYELKWKVLNRGDEAERRNAIRGQIIESSAPGIRYERSNFRGEHVVECYVLKNGVVVARDHIVVPIHINGT